VLWQRDRRNTHQNERYEQLGMSEEDLKQVIDVNPKKAIKL
jgi:hypothetical protein